MKLKTAMMVVTKWTVQVWNIACDKNHLYFIINKPFLNYQNKKKGQVWFILTWVGIKGTPFDIQVEGGHIFIKVKRDNREFAKITTAKGNLFKVTQLWLFRQWTPFVFLCNLFRLCVSLPFANSLLNDFWHWRNQSSPSPTRRTKLRKNWGKWEKT